MTVQKPGLRARSSSVQAALTAQSTGEKPPELPPPPPALPIVAEKAKPVGLSVRLDHDTHEALRRIAFDERVSIHYLLMEGVDLVLKKRLKT